MSKQRTRKFASKILRKTCSSLVKIISDGENNFTQNNYNKLQKISAKNKYFFEKNKCKIANKQLTHALSQSDLFFSVYESFKFRRYLRRFFN